MKKTSLISIVILCMLFTFFAVASGESESVIEANNVAILEPPETTEEQTDLSLLVGNWTSTGNTLDGGAVTRTITLTINEDGSYVCTCTDCFIEQEAFVNIFHERELKDYTSEQIEEIAKDNGYDSVHEYVLSQYDAYANIYAQDYLQDIEIGDDFTSCNYEFHGNSLIFTTAEGEEFLFHRN